jgi:hypothetical protein
MRPALFLFCLLLGSGLAWRCSAEGPGDAVEVTAFDLHRAFRTDPDSARAEYDGEDLLITGEVAHAVTRFRGTTMNGEVEIPAKVMFRTELDTLPHDIKYVEVEGSFDVPDSLSLWALDPRIREGGTLRVSCPRAEIRWTDPGLYISDCLIASD